MAGGSKPAGGWPVVIFSHAITGNRSNMLAMADGYANSGWAVIAIDHPLHGITDTMDPLYLPDTERTFDLDLINNADLSPGPDGRIDDSGAHFINLPSPLTFRDNNRQASADLISLTASIPTMDIDGGGADFDGAQIHFVGISLGSMEGTAYLASNTDVRAAVLSVPGARWTQLALNSETFAPRIIGGLEAAEIPYGTLLFNKFVRDVQNTVDSADPLNFGAAASANHAVLLHEVVGDGAMVLPDQVIPNLVTEQLIAVMQLPSVTTPGVTPGPWGAVRFIAGSHVSLLDPTSSFAATTEMQTEMVVFIAGTPLVPLPGDGAFILISDPTVIRDN
jgi:pimeloyl-ACP methyl ester carboxylesterase